ncbi:MAG: sigma 54-interacting transcriptional regulator [Clostridia bacterium]|nr:sigma 54-interacting transcriptional regulator [Clostridia bacterium]MDH7573217.1 sigma 54-interacting transcriptional regulator [Clostridia bacterium]
MESRSNGEATRAVALLQSNANNILGLLEAIDDAVIVVDAQGKIIYVNKAYERIVGVKAARVLGRNVAMQFPNDKLVQVLQTGIPILESDDYDETFGYRILANCLPIKDPGGKIIGAVGIGTSSPIYHLSQRLASYVNATKAKKQNIPPTREALPSPFAKIIGNDPAFVRALQMAALAALVDCNILLRGETGTGKTLMAEAIHESSFRKPGPFVELNCAAIPESLLESELFGYERGAFTGANPKGKPGKFEKADGGTLFLDEIGDISLNMQAKLLQAIESRRIERIGGTRSRKVNIRLIAATNKHLEIMVQQRQFRADLYYRLNVVPIFVPALRERQGDIPLLATHFLNRFCRAYGKQISFSPAIFQALERHSWPGNVRELANVIEHSVVMCRGSVILPEHLPEYLRGYCSARNPAPQVSSSIDNLKALIENLEKEAISAALKRTGNNRSKAIQLLGISRRSFYEKLRKYQLG